MFYLLCLECVKVLLAQPRIQISVQVRLTKQAQIHTFPLVFFENLMKNQLTFFLPLWLILFSLFRVERKCFAIHWESRSQLSIVMSFSTEVLENCNNLVCVLCFLLQNKLGDTPLHSASWKSHPDIVELLLERGKVFYFSVLANKISRR